MIKLTDGSDNNLYKAKIINPDTQEDEIWYILTECLDVPIVAQEVLNYLNDGRSIDLDMYDMKSIKTVAYSNVLIQDA